MSDSIYCFLTCIQVSQKTGKVVWHSQLFKNFAQFVAIHTVKGFSVVNEAEVGVSLDFPCFFYDPMETITLIKRGLIFKVLVICLQKEDPRFPTTYMNITVQFQVKSISIHMSYLILILKYLSTCVSLCMCVCILMFLVENVCKYEKSQKLCQYFTFRRYN